jgi:hypothetical protein
MCAGTNYSSNLAHMSLLFTVSIFSRGKGMFRIGRNLKRLCLEGGFQE